MFSQPMGAHEEPVGGKQVAPEENAGEQEPLRERLSAVRSPDHHRENNDCQHVEVLRPTGPRDEIYGEDVVDRGVNLGTGLHRPNGAFRISPIPMAVAPTPPRFLFD